MLPGCGSPAGVREVGSPSQLLRSRLRTCAVPPARTVEAVAEDLLRVGTGDLRHDVLLVHPVGGQALLVVHLEAVHEAHDQEALAGQARDDGGQRHVDAQAVGSPLVGRQVGRHPLHVGRLPPEVQLAGHLTAPLTHDGRKVKISIQPPDGVANRLQAFQVGQQAGPDLRVLHLDNHLLAVQQRGPVHGRDARNCQRLRVHRRKHSLQRAAQLLLDDAPDLIEGGRRQRVLAAGQLTQERGRHDVGTTRQVLAQLDPKRFQVREFLDKQLAVALVGGVPELVLLGLVVLRTNSNVSTDCRELCTAALSCSMAFAWARTSWSHLQDTSL